MNDDQQVGRRHATSREDIAKLHEFEYWPARWMWPMLLATLALGAAAGVASQNCWPLLFVIWPIVSAIDFVLVLAFHDASHGRLHPVHWMNEAYGHLMGTIMFTPLSVYRYAHARHHAQLARPGDPELWPFNSPQVSRPLRILAAMVEIVFGMVYTPILFLRSVLVGELTPHERRLIIRGYIACICFWAITSAVASYFGLWNVLIVSLVVPMFLAGMMQTLNKFEQHLGLHGQTVLGLTRTVVDKHKFSEMVSAAMLYNDYHGTHHRYAKIPYYHLPYATPYALAGAREYCPVFPSLASATIDMLYCLANPKVGPQWLNQSEESECKESTSMSNSRLAQPVFTGAYEERAVQIVERV
ncbi:MAG TPA: fatty acid desaturase [Lacipirellulaceae bacterium]|nr:fatty acid desaturase [Lacipirellulaceae bacterium]